MSTTPTARRSTTTKQKSFSWTPQMLAQLAVNPELAQAVKKPEQQETPNFDAVLAKGVERLTNVTTLAKLLEQQAPKEPQATPEPLSSLKQLEDAGIGVRSILERLEAQNQQLIEALEKERQARLDQERQIIELQRADKGSELDFNKALMTMMLELMREQRSKSPNDEALAEIRREIQSLKERPKEDDPVNQAMKETQLALLQSTLDRALNPSNPDPISVLKHQADELAQLKSLFGDSGTDRLAQLELKKLEYEHQARREELEMQREIEYQRVQNYSQMIGQIQQLLPAAIEAFTSSKQQQAGNRPQLHAVKSETGPTPMRKPGQEQKIRVRSKSAPDPTKQKAVCGQCGEAYWVASTSELPNDCTNCGAPFFEDDGDQSEASELEADNASSESEEAEI